MFYSIYINNSFRVNRLTTCCFIIIWLQRYLFCLYPFKVGVFHIFNKISNHLRGSISLENHARTAITPFIAPK